jgi:hypothetical protein
MVEIALWVLVRQCLRGCLPDMEIPGCEVEAWEVERNDSEAGVDWRFTRPEARKRLHRLYPSIED